MSSAGQSRATSPGSARPHKRVLGHGARHRDRALDEFLEHLRRAVAARHHRLPLADQHPQPEILAFRAFELLGLAEPARVRQRDALDHHRIGRIGPLPQARARSDRAAGRCRSRCRRRFSARPSQPQSAAPRHRDPHGRRPTPSLHIAHSYSFSRPIPPRWRQALPADLRRKRPLEQIVEGRQNSYCWTRLLEGARWGKPVSNNLGRTLRWRTGCGIE